MGAELTVKLRTEIDSGNKLKILSKKNQDEITRLNESEVMSKVMEEEKERMILCLKVNIKELETSNEFFNKQLLQQRDETTELSVKLKTEIDSSDKLKILSKMNQDEITRLNELKEISEAMIVTEKNKFICSTQTISCLKEDIKSITTSKESFEKQLLQQRDETTDLIVKLNTETELGMKQKMLSKKNQDEITRLNESGVMSKVMEEEKERMILCLKEDIKRLETSKEGFGKQVLLQRNETTELSVKLKMEIDSGNKLKVLSKERQDEITRLNESRELSETIAEEKERKISCLKVNIKELETSNEVFNKQLLQQRDETTDLSVKFKAVIKSGNKQKMLSKENQDEITRLNESRDLSETMIEEKERIISCLIEDIKEFETSKEVFDKHLLHQRDETGELTLKLRAEIESGNKLKILSKNNQDEIIGLNKSIDLSETIAEEKERTISCLKEDIKELETSKEGFGKQSQQQRVETAELSVRLKTMIDSGNKLKILSKERQDEITRLNESRELL